MLFMGEEWGARTPWQFFSDHEADLGRAVSEGRRREFASHGWDADDIPDPQDRATFVASKLDWSEAETDRGAALLDWNRRLMAVRRAEPDLADPRLGRARFSYDEDEGWFTVRRGSVVVAVNLATSPRQVPVSGDVLLASAQAVANEGAGWTLPAESVAVLRTG